MAPAASTACRGWDHLWGNAMAGKTAMQFVGAHGWALHQFSELFRAYLAETAFTGQPFSYLVQKGTESTAGQSPKSCEKILWRTKLPCVGL